MSGEDDDRERGGTNGATKTPESEAFRSVMLAALIMLPWILKGKRETPNLKQNGICIERPALNCGGKKRKKEGVKQNRWDATSGVTTKREIEMTAIRSNDWKLMLIRYGLGEKRRKKEGCSAKRRVVFGKTRDQSLAYVCDCEVLPKVSQRKKKKKGKVANDCRTDNYIYN